jgi:hypothetical protein
LVICSRVSNNLNGISTIRSQLAQRGVDVREAVLFQFSDGA